MRIIIDKVLLEKEIKKFIRRFIELNAKGVSCEIDGIICISCSNEDIVIRVHDLIAIDEQSKYSCDENSNKINKTFESATNGFSENYQRAHALEERNNSNCPTDNSSTSIQISPCLEPYEKHACLHCQFCFSSQTELSLHLCHCRQDSSENFNDDLYSNVCEQPCFKRTKRVFNNYHKSHLISTNRRKQVQPKRGIFDDHNSLDHSSNLNQSFDDEIIDNNEVITEKLPQLSNGESEMGQNETSIEDSKISNKTCGILKIALKLIKNNEDISSMISASTDPEYSLVSEAYRNLSPKYEAMDTYRDASKVTSIDNYYSREQEQNMENMLESGMVNMRHLVKNTETMEQPSCASLMNGYNDKRIVFEESKICPVCHITLLDFSEMATHCYDCHHQYPCSYCSQSFTQKVNRDRHMLRHTGDKLFYCHTCGLGFTRKEGLRKHALRSGHQSGHTFYSNFKNGFYSDQPQGAEEQGLDLTINSKIISSTFGLHTMSTPDADESAYTNCVKKYRCDRCGDKFTNGVLFTSHCKLQHKRTPCLHCGKTFSQKGNMERHRRQHTGERPFQCVECSACYTRRETLKAHMMQAHSGKDASGLELSCSSANMLVDDKRSNDAVFDDDFRSERHLILNAMEENVEVNVKAEMTGDLIAIKQEVVECWDDNRSDDGDADNKECEKTELSINDGCL